MRTQLLPQKIQISIIAQQTYGNKTSKQSQNSNRHLILIRVALGYLQYSYLIFLQLQLLLKQRQIIFQITNYQILVQFLFCCYQLIYAKCVQKEVFLFFKKDKLIQQNIQFNNKTQQNSHMKTSLIESRYLESSKLHLSDIFKSSDRKDNPKKTKKIEFLRNIKQKLCGIKLQSYSIVKEYQDFKENALTQFNISMGRISCSHTKLIHKKLKIQDQLEKSKENQNKMKAQVLQLRQMIQEFLKEYNQQISSRDRQIQYLTQILNEQNIYPQFKDHRQEGNKLQDQCLDPIIQQSQQTASNATSKITVLSLNSISNNQIQTQTNRANDYSRSSSKRARNFIGDFRKTIQQSVPTKNIEIVKKFQNIKVFPEGFKKQQKRESQQLVNEISKSSSSNELVVLGEIDRINIPLKCQSPKNMMFLKKRSKRIFTQENRMSTQGSQIDKQNIQGHCLSRNSSQERSQIIRGSISGNSQTRRNVSKQKIKVTCKIIQEFNFHPKKKTHKRTGSVHLGNKNYINKLKNSLKNAFQNYDITVIKQQQEVQYEGSMIKSIRHGFGRLLYRNGVVFEGNFYNNEKQGKGKLMIGNKIIFQGEWQKGEINGKGQIQCLKFLCANCPQILSEAAFIGQFMGNKFHGNCSLFLNKKEKILTKFLKGVPVGQFSLHSEDSIDFGFWKQ